VLLIQSLHILGWKVNAYDYDGRTALGIAASEGHLECVKYLVSHGANPLHRDIRNNDALADARREGRTEVVEFLEKILSKRQ
jgi:glutaminase